MTRLTKLHDQLANHLGEIAAARRRTLNGCDPEGLHDLRVALRALRVMLPLFGKKLGSLRREWQIQAHATGPCRDQEVLLALLDTLPDIPVPIHERLTQQECETRAALLEQLATANIPKLIQRSRIDLCAVLHRLTPNQLRRRTSTRAEQLQAVIVQQITALTPNSPAEAWHLLRLDVKRLRYLIEHCGNWLPKRWLALHPPLKRCQTALGELHDMDLLISLTACPLDAARKLRLDDARTAVIALSCALN